MITTRKSTAPRAEMTTLCVQQNILPRVMNTQLVRSTKKSEVKVWRHSKRLWRSMREMSYAGLIPRPDCEWFCETSLFNGVLLLYLVLAGLKENGIIWLYYDFIYYFISRRSTLVSLVSPLFSSLLYKGGFCSFLELTEYWGITRTRNI